MEIKKMNLEIRKYTEKDLSENIRIWNEGVDISVTQATLFHQMHVVNILAKSWY